MSAIDELCALGFEKYWVHQALELTNHSKDYALEWLLSDEFKLAREQFNLAKKKFAKKKNTPSGQLPALPNKNVQNNVENIHEKQPSLQAEPPKPKPKPKEQAKENDDFVIEYDMNGPDLKPKTSIADFKFGIDHLLEDSDDSDSNDPKKKKNVATTPQEDADMNNFLLKLKAQVSEKSGQIWLCHSCQAEVASDRTDCHMCHMARLSSSDWICDTCSFVNQDNQDHCQMCLTETNNQKGNAIRREPSLKASQTWICAACKYHNANTKICKMCGYVFGSEISNVNDEDDNNNSDSGTDMLLELAKSHNKPDIVLQKNANEIVSNKNKKIPVSPNKHVSGHSGVEDDVFGDIGGWNNNQKKDESNGSAMVMVERKKAKKEVVVDEDDDSVEESSIDEQVFADIEDDNENVQVMQDNTPNKMIDVNDFDIPMMDENIIKTESAVYESQPTAPPKEKEQAKDKELTGFELLKSMYGKDEKKHKVKIKLRVGTLVDIYSSSKQDWVEGIIKEIKGDLICIVYGKHMKWLRKNSRQLRPKAQYVRDALNKKNEPIPNIDASNAMVPEPLKQSGSSPIGVDEPPPAFAMNHLGMKAATMHVNNDDIEEFQPPPPSDPPPAFENELLNGNQHENPVEAHEQGQVAKADEFDYDVTFTTSVLGLELYPDKDGKNCVVGKCLSKTSKKFVDPGSMIVRVNDFWVGGGMSYDMVRDAIKQAAKYPPLKIGLRVKMNNIGKNKNVAMNERGYLKIKVVAGVQLKHRASYCVVQVGNARLSTREVARDEHPEWQEMLTFKNFRPDQGKKAIVTVFDHSTILKDKKIGTTEYSLPINFNKLQRDTLELKSTKGKLSGVIILNTIIVHKSNSIRHLRKY